MSAGQGVHRPTRIVLQLVVELGEARGIGGQDVHLLFDTGRLRPNPAEGIGATNQSSPGTVTRPEVIALWEGKSGPHPLATLTQPLQSPSSGESRANLT
jgi:hypothetical protein